MKKVWLLWGLFLLAGTCFGQGVPYFSNVFTSANSAPPGSQTTMYTVPFSTVTVCGAIPVGNPCTNTVVIYANAGMTVTAHNPITTDVHGKFNFWAPAGTYSYSLKSASGTLLGTYYFTLGGSGGGSSLSLQHNGTALANQNVLNFNDTTPAAPSGNVNVVFLTDSTGRISGYVPISASSFILTTTGTSGPATYTSGTLNIPDYTYTLTVPKITALGTLTNDTSGSAAKIGGVAVSGTPGIGQLPVATGAGTASWQTISATGGISGQTTNCLLKANSATTSNASGPICDDGTTTTITHPVAINSTGPSQVKFTYNGTPLVPAAGSGVFGADASGNAVSSDNGAAVSRVCTAGNGVCGSTPPYIAPQAIAGCGVEYVSGLTYTVGACNYSINGVSYSSPLSTITLPAADATNPEIDVVFVDITGVVQVIQGTPAVTPQQPVVDPSTQLQLTFVLVPATATTPANTTSVLIYDEGTEWTAAKGGTSSANVNLASTNNPYHGTIDTEFGAGGTVASTTYAQYTKPSAGTVTLGNYNTLTLYLRNKAAWPKTRSVTVQWYNGATPLGTAIVLSNGAYGLDATGNITSYQQISIPTSTFGIAGTPATTVRFTVTGSGSSLTGFYLDEVSLQGGNGGTVLPTTLMNFRGAWSATVTYAPNDTVVSGGTGYVALASNTNTAVSTTATWSALAPAAVSSGFPITLGSTSVAASSTTTAVTGLTVNSVTLDATGSSTLFLNKAGGYTTPAGTGTVTTTGTPASGNLSKFSGSTSVTNGDLSGDVTTSGTLATTVASVAGTAAATIKIRAFGTTFGDTGGSALTSGSVVYFTVPYACTVSAWNMTVDAGTATVDIWKIASGTAIPTVANTITASALPAISTGTAVHSTTLTGWTTAVTANDIFAFQLKTVATAKYVGITLQCNQ